MKKLKVKNWKRYAIEFLSIFIAVISAFALNNWNDNRNSRNAENKILSEIVIGLEKDLEDIRINKNGHHAGIFAVKYMREILTKNQIAQDSFMIHYLNLTRDFVSIQNTSGYETLKSRGLELIQNDSLRTKIISLYEYDYNTLRKLEEEYYELQFQKNYFKEINTMIAPNLKLNKNKQVIGISLPLNLSHSDERLFLTYLWKIQTNRSFIIHYYQAVENKIAKLQAEINAEL